MFQQFRPLEATLALQRSVKNYGELTELTEFNSEINMDMCQTPTLATNVETRTELDTQDSVNNSLKKETGLKEKAQVWYQQFMAQNSKYKVGRVEPAEQCAVTHPQDEDEDEDDGAQ